MGVMKIQLISKYRIGEEPEVIENYSDRYAVQFVLDDGRKVRLIHRGDHLMVHTQDGARSWSITSVGGLEDEQEQS